MRLGDGFRRWLAIVLACGLIAAVLRWGMAAIGPEIRPVSTAIAPLSFVPTRAAAIALTFEVNAAGPALNGVLRTLTAYGVPATCFVSGHLLTASPAAVTAMRQAGEEVELAAPPGLGQPGNVAGVEATLRAETTALKRDATTPHFVQAHPGGFAPQGFQEAQAAGLTVVGWSLDSEDWAQPGADVIIGNVLGAAQAGDIVRLHATEQTVQALPAIIESLRARHLQLVTLDGLLALSEGAAGGSVGSGATASRASAAALGTPG